MGQWGMSRVMARMCDPRKNCAMWGDKDDGNDKKDDEGLQWVPGRMMRNIERDGKAFPLLLLLLY